MIKDQIKAHQIPIDLIPHIKEGADYKKSDGQLVSHKELTKPAHKARSFAFCSDTAYSEEYVPYIKGVDLLYHEVLKNDLKERAEFTYHSTTAQAALIAKKAEANRLVIGHYSQQYKDLDPLLEEVKAVFSNAELAIEGKTFEIVRAYDTDC